MIKKYKFMIIIYLLFLLVGCSGINDDSRFSTPTGTLPFITDEEKGSADLRVVETIPESKYVGPPLSISIKFNEDIDRTSIEKNLYIGDIENRVVKCKYFYYEVLDSPEVIVELMLLDNLVAQKQYYINIGKGCKSILGEHLKETQKLPFIFSHHIMPIE